MQNSKKIPVFAPSAAFFAQFCVTNENFFTGAGKKNREEIGMFWFEEGKNWNCWPKYLPFVEIS